MIAVNRRPRVAPGSQRGLEVVCHEPISQGYWSVLGGCDPGEHPDDAIVLELDEEVGLKVEDRAPALGILDGTGSGQLLTVYTGTWTGDPATLPLSEGQELRFIPPADLPGLLVPPHIRAVLDRVQPSA